MKATKVTLVLVLMLALIIPALTASSADVEIPDFGTLYGDLYVILRDVDGVPMLADNGCIQPISSVDAYVSIPTNGDPLVIYVDAGEPFALPTYTDSAGDLVECELTEEMATWVQTVDFGRLNLGRAPYSVIAHAFDEAINKMNVAQTITIDPAGRLVLTVPDEEGDYVAKTIDSPAENLALYIKMMVDGHWITLDTDPVEPGGQPIEVGGRPEGKGKPIDDPEDPDGGDGPSLEDRPVLSEEAVDLLAAIGYGGLGDTSRTTGEALTSDELLLAASLLAAAADKTGNITLDKLMYINSIYGINQVGTLPTGVEGEAYFDFRGLSYYARSDTFVNRQSGICEDGWIWVIQPEETPDYYKAQCMEILGYEHDPYDPESGHQPNAVHFTHMVEAYTTVYVTDENGNPTTIPLTYDFTDNVRAFAQAADDALQVLEYIHNYKVPEVLYPAP